MSHSLFWVIVTKKGNFVNKHVGDTVGKYWSWVEPPGCGVTVSVVVNTLVLCSKRRIFRPTLL